MPIETLLWIIIGLLLAHILYMLKAPKLAGIGGQQLAPWQLHELARLRLQINNVFGDG